MTKHVYNQPEVTVKSIGLGSNILIGSPAGDQMGLSETPTNSQW